MSEDSSPERMVPAQSTRSAERNRKLAGQADPPPVDVFLPSLAEGVTLLDVDEGRGLPALQSLVLDHLLRHDGPAFWVDANGHATTTTLGRIAPSRRLLDRIHVARGFTAYQHFAAVRGLPDAVNRAIRQSTAATPDRSAAGHDGGESPHTPSLIVAPAVDGQYRADDSLADEHAETLQARTLARLRTYADAYDAPVLLTRTDRTDATAPIETAADQHVECERTRMGPRFVAEDFETHRYPVDDGAYYQTTLAYWRRLLAARATQIGAQSDLPSPVGPGADDAGRTAGSGPDSATVSPLLDAWTAAGGGR